MQEPHGYAVSTRLPAQVLPSLPSRYLGRDCLTTCRRGSNLVWHWVPPCKWAPRFFVSTPPEQDLPAKATAIASRPPSKE